MPTIEVNDQMGAHHDVETDVIAAYMVACKVFSQGPPDVNLGILDIATPSDLLAVERKYHPYLRKAA